MSVRCAAVILASSIAIASAGAATITTFDGAKLDGDAVLDAKSVVVAGNNVALTDCDQIHFGAALDLGAAHFGLWLRDGSWLPVSTIAASPAKDEIAVDGPLGAMRLPLLQILAWGPLTQADPGAKPQRCHVVLDDSSSVDGELSGVADGMILLKTDLGDEPVPIPIARALQLRADTAVQPRHGLYLAATLDDAHPPLALQPGKALHLFAAPTVAIDIAKLGVVRVEGGRRTYLAALPLAKDEEEGAFGKVWPHSIDSDLEGGPLILGKIRYAHGMVVHSKALLAWNLDGAYERLHAVVGISDLVEGEGDCAVSLLGDGKSLWSRESVKGSDAPLPLDDISLRGVKLLELHVDYGARYDIGDHFALADAWLVKAK